MARPNRPKVEKIDGCPPSRGIVVNSQTPTIRLMTDVPIDSYDWELWQAGEKIDGKRNVTAGITNGTCIVITPTKKLRKGPPREWKLGAGFFLPPFSPRRTYRTETYAGHSNFSVDFNRGPTGTDEGDIVRAPARGTVAVRNFRAPGTNGPTDPGESDLLIQHAGNIATLYTHMKDVRAGLQPGAQVGVGQVLGRISAVGNATGSHLHHCHFRRSPNERGFGRPIKMRIRGEPMEASVGDSASRPQGFGKFGQNVRSYPYRPYFQVRVRVASEPRKSPWARCGFVVSAQPTGVPGCVDPGCPGAE